VAGSAVGKSRSWGDELSRGDSEADDLKGMRTWPSLRTDLRHPGADAVDEEVCIDGQFTTSRSPADLPAFCPAIVKQFSRARVAS
jgi:protease I